MSRYFLASLAILVISYYYYRMDNKPTTTSANERDVLPTNVKPLHYDLKLTPNLAENSFQGIVSITVQVKEASSSVVMNANELTIQSVKVTQKSAVQATYKLDASLETLTVNCSLVPGQALIEIHFVGILNDKMAGFYRSEYTLNGEKKIMAVTQFEATDARRAFPCWDEPALKATFTVTLVIDSHLTGLSNMNVEKEEHQVGKKILVFAKTPLMSTYLLAFVVGELEFIEDHTKEGVAVRVYAIKGEAKRGQFGLQVARDTLSFFTNYFDMPYPLPKMDLVAIPDFSAGAMENWGLVTYRTVYLLFDQDQSSLKTKQNVAYVVGHELAHQWFGNIVTMDWWSDLWLNEGFATWVGWLAVDHLFPEWQVWLAFINDDQQRGLSLDSMRSSHPIQVPVKNPSEISQIFDAISYSKGASVIHMLVNFLGEATFQKGMRAYLKKHQYGNAATSDLWKALSDASGKNVNQMMNTWTSNVGFPVISAEMFGGKVKVRQNRFLSSGDVTPSDDLLLWQVPLGIRHSYATKDALLSEREQIFELPPEVTFAKINSLQTGFYRVLYSLEMLEKIKLSFFQLTRNDKIGIVADAFSLAVAGAQSTTVALSLLESFTLDDGYIVWSEISSRLMSVLDLFWEDSVTLELLKKSLAKIYIPLVDELGFEFSSSDDDLTSLLRTTVISVAAKLEYSAVIEEAKKRFAKYIAGDTSVIHPNVRDVIFKVIVQFGGKQEYDKILSLYHEFSVADQKLGALRALGATRDPLLIERSLELSLTSDVRSQDIIYLIGPIADNPVGRIKAFEFMKANWNLLYDRYYKGSVSILNRIVTSCCQGLGTKERAQLVEEFFKPKEVSGIQRAINQSLESIKISVAWIERDREAISKWASTK